VFHGALDPARLSLAERLVAKGTKAPVGDFRPWDAIDAWAAGVARDLEHVTGGGVTGAPGAGAGTV
jgi:menaquinone-dependent protoporphyrinogen oxidase